MCSSFCARLNGRTVKHIISAKSTTMEEITKDGRIICSTTCPLPITPFSTEEKRTKIMPEVQEPPTVVAKLLYKNQWTRLMYRWKWSIGTFGFTGALGVVWLFDVQLSDYLKYFPIFKRRFGNKHD